MDFMISLFGSDQSRKVGSRRRRSTAAPSAGACAFEVDSQKSLPPEDGEGNIEYKLKLYDPPPPRFEHLVTQLKWRLREGQGEAIYEIGVEDSGNLAGLTDHELDASLSTLRRMADRLGASFTLLRERDVLDDSTDDVRRRVAEVLIRLVPESQQFIDIRVAVLGCADAGKSTLLGVLTQGEMDNGRGRARLNLFRHLHEIQTGRTSSISLDMMGFGADGEAITYQDHSVEEMLEKSTKMITFIDLAGHDKYLKTTIFGLTGYSPHFCMLVVAADVGVASTTKEHLGLALALELPFFVVVTKFDLVTPAALKKTLMRLESILKASNCKRIPVRVQCEDDALTIAGNINNEQDRIVPIFVVSSVTGSNLDLLTNFLNVLPPIVRDREASIQEPVEFQIDEVFQVQGVGVVVAGLVSKGVLREGDELMLGPSLTGEFYPVHVESLHRNKSFCRVVESGHAASLAIGELKDVALRKGMVAVDPMLGPRATMSFEASVFLLYHPHAYICQGFQMTMHIGNVCQTAFIVRISKSNGSLRTNESAVVCFKFLKQPEYLVEGARLLFREGKTKGIGRITKVFAD